jgi:hypothetical protein
MFLYSTPVIIRKARTRRKVSHTYTKTSKYSKLMAKGIQMNLSKGFKSFKRGLNRDQIEEAVKTGNVGNIQRLIPWNNLDTHLKQFPDLLAKVSGGSMKISSQGLPERVSSRLRFDWRNPAIKSWVKNRTGELVVGIQLDTQKVIQRAVMRSFTKAYTPRQVADEIKNSMGLYPRQQEALVNYRTGLEQDKKIDPDRVDSFVDKYSDRLLDQRAMTIARTETRFATNQGQIEIWNQAADQGLINHQTSKKVWIVDGNPCEICEPMDGVAVPIEESWTLNTGETVDNPTDAHPNCFCGMELEMGEGE